MREVNQACREVTKAMLEEIVIKGGGFPSRDVIAVPLEDAGLIAVDLRCRSGYRLTPLGREVMEGGKRQKPDDELKAALDRVYAVYGSDLAAFFEDDGRNLLDNAEYRSRPPEGGM